MNATTLHRPKELARSASDFSAPAMDDARYAPHHRELKHGLTAAQLTEFQAKGFLLLRGVFSRDEASAWDRACNEVLKRRDLIHPDNLRFELHQDKQTGAQAVWKIDPFLDIEITLGALTRDRRILDPLCSIYAGREPRIFKDKLIYKPPGGHGNGLHQDYNWWQGFPTSLISVLVAIDPATKENGCTELFPGYQKGLFTKPGAFGDLKEDRVDLGQVEYMETQPGDIVLFHCFAPHRAGPNASAQWRRQIFLTYNDSAAGEHYQAHRDHYLWYVTRSRKAEEKARKFFL
ncbi:MAG: phytanoyl-CoA dioxygenase family protein [Planctomycetes bacterium]|nr:phytanoyl-CoA dioxygenase family protein [Planctomycetota bacterium]